MEASEVGSLQKTPLYNIHVSMGAKMAPFGGWFMPIQYEGILAEHAHTRSSVSVFDICHMGEFILEADPVSSLLDRIVTQNIVSMPIGACRYGFMLNEGGGVIDDLVVYRLGDASWMLVVNAATISGDEAHLRKNLSGKVSFENISNATGKLDVQGPGSADALKKIFGAGIAKLAYYTFGKFKLWGMDLTVSRTGYTGELGYEVYIPSDNAVRLWNTLLEDKRVKPAGLGCRDTLRLEMGYPLYGQDLDTGHTPIAAGFDKFVDLGKEFIGKDALLKEKKGGVKERLVSFKSDTRRSPRHNFAIFKEGLRVGTVTSGSFSPSLLSGIGMGYVSGKCGIGDKLVTKDGNTEIPVTVVKKPFYNKK
ncbi:MAG: glycine cleavage system aminomethyltransferase GcvT [Candidatus Omnitrophica bacterium]|nr:glycine cleavage system aminomethyltransferase GcvT [Candidatus Omnitrophota bacterium]MDD5436570.1 glycine cleavage system aminomethyltransferase GcvT [Candidatus Omnitrophota bacterium]